MIKINIPKWDSQNYHLNSSAQWVASLELLSRVSIQPHYRVLDVGCGDGKITSHISKKASQSTTIGIDTSTSMINFANEHFAKTDRLEFYVNCATSFDFGFQFDLIFSSFALQWVLDIEKFFQKASKQLKSGGTLVVTAPLDISEPLHNCINEISKKKKWAPFFINFKESWTFRDKHEFSKLLKNNQFKINFIEKKEHLQPFTSLDALKSYVFQWLPHLSVIPIDQQKEYMNEIFTLYAEREKIDPNTSLIYKFFKVDFVGERI